MIWNRFKSQSRRRFRPNYIAIIVIIFVISIIAFNFFSYFDLLPKTTYYTENEESAFPVLYIYRNEKRLNEMRAYQEVNYSDTANQNITLLQDERELNILSVNNGNIINEIEYEVREKTTNKLIERTRLGIDTSEEDETIFKMQIQNLIRQNESYLLIINVNLGAKQVHYFANIMSKPKNRLDEVLDRVEAWTKSTFDDAEARSIVQYLETNKNVDQRQLHDVSIESSYEQITWANTNMELISDLVFDVYQVQDYSFNINIRYLTKSKNDKENYYYTNVDQFVLRWDDRRYYYMKFNRDTEELTNIDNKPFDDEKKRFYIGVTDPNDFVKIESANKKYFAFAKNKEIYFYDSEKNSIKAIYSKRPDTREKFLHMSQDYDVKIMEVSDEGNVKFIKYGYEMEGINEGYIGIDLYEYTNELDVVEEKIFIPVFTTYQNLKYDVEKLCIVKDNRVIFKNYNNVYSVDIDLAESILLAENFEETRFAASPDNKYFAYNVDLTHINIYDIDESRFINLEANKGENIQVITFMNDDVFYAVSNAGNVWVEDSKIIGRPCHEIVVKNVHSGEEKHFNEKDRYQYNFVDEGVVLRYNKYSRNGNHYTFITNDVIVNNYFEESEIQYPFLEEYTRNKLRIGYLNMEKKGLRFEKTTKLARKESEPLIFDTREIKEDDIYYVYNSGKLVKKLKVLSDAVDAIRNQYGYVKLNNKWTCYNRANKGNVSYLRQDDSILENLEGFKENFYLKDNKILVMNVTGVTERDLEYYISLKEKIAVFRNDTFLFFITGYDNVNYVIEYPNRDRILTNRNEVKNVIQYGGVVLFAQLENLE